MKGRSKWLKIELERSLKLSPMAQSLTSTTRDRLTFEEYLFHEGEPGIRYELYQGRLIPIAIPAGLHTDICKFLVYQLQRHFATYVPGLVAVKDTGVRTDDDGARVPDVLVCRQSLWEQVRGRAGSGVLNFGEVPLLVVEVTSENWRQDYILKRAQYALVDIPEYWIVDANRGRVRILTHPENEDGYQHTDFISGQEIYSPQFPELVLSVSQLLSPPIVETLVRQEHVQREQLDQQVDQERQRANQEQQRAERLARKLMEMGIDLDSI